MKWTKRKAHKKLWNLKLVLAFAAQVIFGFQTPPDSGEKLTLCITILMSLTFFMNMVGWVFNTFDLIDNMLISASPLSCLLNSLCKTINVVFHMKKPLKNWQKINQVSAMQPPSSNTPLIGTYFSCIMVKWNIGVLTTLIICLIFYHGKFWWTKTWIFCNIQFFYIKKHI